MHRFLARTFTGSIALIIASAMALAAAPSAEVKAKAEAKAKQLAWLSTDPKVVAAVKEQNASPSAEAKAMTQDKWQGLNVLDPFVKSLAKNSLADYLKGKKDDSMSELFVSGADGTKVAFFAKTSGWSHKGKDKHDVPMKGSTWYGPIEVDQSSGVEQMQIAMPVLDGGKPIGSVVVGLAVAKLN